MYNANARHYMPLADYMKRLDDFRVLALNAGPQHFRRRD